MLRKITRLKRILLDRKRERQKKVKRKIIRTKSKERGEGLGKTKEKALLYKILSKKYSKKASWGVVKTMSIIRNKMLISSQYPKWNRVFLSQ